MGLETGLSVALFPMVIIAMTIERMSVIWEGRGAQDAIAAVEGVDLVLVSYWGLGLRDAESRTSFDLRGEDPGLLRDLTAVRSSGR